MITEYSKSSPPAQMVWASIWLDSRGHARRSPLVIMERDLDAPHNGYTTRSYLTALKEGLVPYYQPGQVFMQDNARIHTSLDAREFLMDHGVWVMDWPPYSPDLNPIEHLWHRLKLIMYKEYPQFNQLGSSVEEVAAFYHALKEAWLKIPNLLIRKVILSMPNRLAACRKSRGRQTKY